MTARLISSIRIERLFGLYTYTIPDTGELTNAAILYGDNGVGKTTLLRLAFHLLSAANNRGHRTALYGTDFKRIEVTLSSGVTLTAKVLEPVPPKILQLEVLKNDKKLAVWDYLPQKERIHEEEGITVEIDEHGRPVVLRKVSKPRKKEFEGVPYGEPAYLQALKEHVPTLFMLNADRRLDSDAVSDPDDEVEIRRTMMFDEPKRINELVTRSREIALSQALNRTSRWISRKAVIGTNKGAMNVHSVYGDVLRRLVSPSSRTAAAEPTAPVQDLMLRLVRIEEKTAEHARYELATSLKTTEFRRALGGRRSKKTALAAELLLPYVKSVESRLDAIDPIYQLVDRFVTIMNGLLTDKSVSFKVGQGFAVQNRLGVPLSAGQLSSGEQQLLLLFCYVLTARDTPTVFMVDEPEISLNIKWQRRLVQSLLDITQDANVQFIFASHSLELLAQHRNRVVKLVNKS